jgi:hypothetical protein
MRHARSATSLALAALAAAATAKQPAAPTAPQKEDHVRGIVGSVFGDTVTVRSADGRSQTKLELAGGTRVSLASKGDLNAIRKDAYVGVTAVEGQGGTLRALEVHVFPESARGAGEGHRPWDLKPGSSMTNATVSGVGAAEGGGSGSSMTNATVSGVSGAAGGRELELTYKYGKKTVFVPPGTPVVTLERADRSAIKPGKHVFAAGPRRADGAVTVDRMVVGRDGVRPPM